MVYDYETPHIRWQIIERADGVAELYCFTHGDNPPYGGWLEFVSDPDSRPRLRHAPTKRIGISSRTRTTCQSRSRWCATRFPNRSAKSPDGPCLLFTKPVQPPSASFLRFAMPVDVPPAGDGWLHQIKHHGNHTLIVVDRGKVRAFTRRGLDWSTEYGRLCEGASKLRCRIAILDGEAIVQGKDGRADFTALRRAIRREPHRLVFFAFASCT